MVRHLAMLVLFILTLLGWLGALVEEDLAVLGEVLHLLHNVLLLLLFLLSAR